MQANGGETISTSGSFSVSLENTTTFIMGLRSWARSILDALPIDSKGRVLSGSAKTALDFVKGIDRVVAERQSNNSGDQQELAPVLPHQLRHVAPFRFQEFVQIHRRRLETTVSVEEINLIEQEHRQFRDADLNEHALRTRLDAAIDNLSFKDAWCGLHERWPHLSTFCGGLAAIFPGTATVESDFSFVKFEKRASGQRLTDFSIEGILHAKQYDKLRAV